MSTVNNVIYVFDSRQRTSGTTNVATYNMIPAGSLDQGTYESLSYHSTNQFYNVEVGVNDDIFWDEGAGDLTATIPPGYYATPVALAAAVKIVMDVVSASTFTITYNTDTGKFLFAIAAGTFRFKFLTNTTAVARELIGFSATDGVLAATQTSDNQVSLTLHTNILVDISEDAEQNVTLASDGSERSLIVPITGVYQEEIDSLKAQVFAQTLVFTADFNSITISLFTEDGSAPVNISDYVLIIRRLF